MRDFKIGQTESVTKTITDADIHAYAQLSGDYNPLHVDDDYARQSRFKSRIAHGMLIASLISNILGMKLPGTGGIYVSQQMRFLKPVRIGDTITCVGEVLEWNATTRMLTIQTDCFNQRGEKIIEGRGQMLVESRRPGFELPL